MFEIMWIIVSEITGPVTVCANLKRLSCDLSLKVQGRDYRVLLRTVILRLWKIVSLLAV